MPVLISSKAVSEACGDDVIVPGVGEAANWISGTWRVSQS
jgi:hypothetical protein